MTSTQTPTPGTARDRVTPYEAAGDRTQDLRIKRTEPMHAKANACQPVPHGSHVARPDATRSDAVVSTQTPTPGT
jgi:hypothetical protein